MQKELSLSPCPESPNCVSSQSQDPDQYVKPFPYSGTIENSKARLLALFKSFPRTHVTSNTENYLHIEMTSFLFRFIDDVEFLFDEEQKLIHVRSASRTGYWDLGVNRKRIEALRKKFLQSA